MAEQFGKGRIFIGGDAAHLFTPIGGLGYNTAIEDAVNLGWKLAACSGGAASRSCSQATRPNAGRSRCATPRYAKGFADSLGSSCRRREIEDDTPAGEAARAARGQLSRRARPRRIQHSRHHLRRPLRRLAGRSCADGTAPPPDTANVYVSTACPGGRPPHLWMPDGRSLYDLFGFEWTLLCSGKNETPPLPESDTVKVLDLNNEEACDLYAADFVLIRPDQIVAWRGNAAEEVPAALNRLLGQTSIGAHGQARS